MRPHEIQIKKIGGISLVAPFNNFTETVPDTSYIIGKNNIHHYFQYQYIYIFCIIWKTSRFLVTLPSQ